MRKPRKVPSVIPIIETSLGSHDNGNLREILKMVKSIESLSPETLDIMMERSKKNILKDLKIVDSYDVKYITDDIKSIWEYFYIEKSINDLAKTLKGSHNKNGDSKKLHEKKRKFDRTKERILRDLGSIGITSGAIIEEVKNKAFEIPIIDQALEEKFIRKLFKKALFLDLTELCGTGIHRAKSIIKIIEHFPI
jgi:hypothetical protein